MRKCVIILSLKLPPHLKCVATLPCEMSSVFKATIENKTTSVTTHFKEINKEQRVYCLSYCLKSLSHPAIFWGHPVYLRKPSAPTTSDRTIKSSSLNRGSRSICATSHQWTVCAS